MCDIFATGVGESGRTAANFNHIDSMFILTFYWFGYIWVFLGYYGLFFPQHSILISVYCRENK